MRHCITILLLFFAFSSIATGQTTRQLIDSSRYYKTRDNAKALAFSDAAYKRAVAQKETRLVGESACLLGVNYYLSGNYDEALRWYLESEKLFTAAKDASGLADVYNELVVFYLRLKKFPQAEEVSAKAIASSIVVNDAAKIANAYNQRGLVFLDEQKYDSAVAVLNYAYALYKASEDKVGMSYSIDYLASAYMGKNMLDTALEYFKESKELRVGLGDKTAAAISINGIGEIYMMKNMPKEAIAYFKEAAAQSHELNYTLLEAHTYDMLSKAYQDMGNYKDAFISQENFIKLNDTMLQQQKLKEAEDREVKYQANKKEERNRLLTEQNNTQEARLNRNKIAIYALLLITILSAGLFYLLYIRNKLKQQARLKEAIMEEQRIRTRDVLVAEENERKRIAADLHDGVGQIMSAAKMNLSAIQSELHFADEEQMLLFDAAIKMVDAGCKEVRVISHNMMPNALLKVGLTAAVREFVNQIPDKVLNVQLHAEGLDDSLDKATETVIYRVVQECVQNVIKHAAASQLDISLMKDADGIDIMVEDNGKGFDTSRIANESGLGTGNMIKRISYLKGTIEWSSTPGSGTLVSIHIPAGKTL